MRLATLGYLGVESPEAKRWEEFGPEILGMQVVDGDDGVLLRMDDRHHRIAVRNGPRDRLAYLGWEVASPEGLDDAAETLQRHGLAVKAADDELRHARQVTDAIVFHDPLGFRHELFYGQLSLPGAFHVGRAMSGFVTGGHGLGHAVLVVPELEPASAFYRSVMGFRLSDVIAGQLRLEFFHVNPRHHSLAIMEIPGLKGLQHVMVQVGSLDDVGTAYDLCQQQGHEITLTLGRHTNDQMLSFYVKSPSGFDIEYGYGAIEVDPDIWVVGRYDRPSSWGHRFQGSGPPGAVETAS